MSKIYSTVAAEPEWKWLARGKWLARAAVCGLAVSSTICLAVTSWALHYTRQTLLTVTEQRDSLRKERDDLREQRDQLSSKAAALEKLAALPSCNEQELRALDSHKPITIISRSPGNSSGPWIIRYGDGKVCRSDVSQEHLVEAIGADARR
jgi:hypothetical protein